MSAFHAVTLGLGLLVSSIALADAEPEAADLYLLSGQYLLDGYRAHQQMMNKVPCSSAETCLQRRDRAVTYAARVMAHLDMHVLLDKRYGVRFFCSSGGVSYAQSLDIVGAYLERNPERRHRLGSELIIDALGNAFPCAK